MRREPKKKTQITDYKKNDKIKNEIYENNKPHKWKNNRQNKWQNKDTELVTIYPTK